MARLSGRVSGVIWADRVAVVWAGVVYAFMLYAIAMGSPTEAEVWQAVWIPLVVAVLPAWLFLRGLNWIAGGRRSA